MKLLLKLNIWGNDEELTEYFGFEGEKEEAAALIEKEVLQHKVAHDEWFEIFKDGHFESNGFLWFDLRILMNWIGEIGLEFEK